MQRYFALEKKDNIFTLENGDIHHICNVMRCKEDDSVEVVYDNKLYICRVKLEPFSIILDKHVEDECNDFLDVCLIIPVLKEQKMDLVLQKATELGVNRIIPIITERCIVKVSEKEDKKLIRWRKIVKEASEQCKRVSVPVIDSIRKIDDLFDLDGVKLVCSTVEKSKNIKNVMQTLKKCDRMFIVVGPEGGLSIKEEHKLNELGFDSISLGSRIMRVETVPLFVLSILNYEMME